MITVREALEIIHRHVSSLGEESVPLSRAFGRVLARDVSADGDFPPFETTAMDGYAVRFGPEASLFRARPGVCSAGQPPPPPLEAGAALRVMTGAPVPEGTDAVIPLEDAQEEAGRIRARKEPKPGAHLRRRGEVFRRGDALLAAGARLTPGAILLAATVGAEPLPVVRRPRCAVAATGSEIVPATAVPGPGQIRNGNGPALVAALARRGVDAEELPAVPDRREDLAAFFAGLGSGRDLVVTTGGVSGGDFDHTAQTAEESGFEILFHGVAVKPGKPVAFGKRGGVFWLGLPGNPVSALVTFEIFGGEAFARMEGRARGGARVAARLRSGTVERGAREVFRDCALSVEEGILLAEPIPSRGSHDILAQARRNALMRLAAGGGRWEEGARVECVPLESFLE